MATIPSKLHLATMRLLLGRAAPNPFDYPSTPAGLTRWLHDAGVTHFSGPEYVRSSSPRVLVERARWPNVGACLAVVEIVRALDDRPILLKAQGGYRPTSRLAHSDHRSASAVDVELGNRRRQVTALETVLEELWSRGLVGLSIGIGRSSGLHIGVWAPRTQRLSRQRAWTYDRAGLPCSLSAFQLRHYPWLRDRDVEPAAVVG